MMYNSIMYPDVLYLFTHTLQHVQWMLFIGCTFILLIILMLFLSGYVSIISLYSRDIILEAMCRIMVNQTMALSGNEKLTNQGYVNLPPNCKVILKFISKSCKKLIYRK